MEDPRTHGTSPWTRAILVAAGGAALHAWVLRPWMNRWGATEEEARRTLPGDEELPRGAWQATRAVTVGAPPEAVWPWLVQIGHGRGGFYSYDVLDHGGVPSARRIEPALQDLRQGDEVLLAPTLPARVAVLEPGRALVLAVHGAPIEGGLRADMTLGWFLEPTPGGASRLLGRLRGSVGRGLAAWCYVHLLFEVVDFLMMRKQLLTLKARAEG